VTTFIKGCLRPDPVANFLRRLSLTLVHGLEWYHSHLKTCHFQSALFLTDSQLVLALLFTTTAFLQLQSFWDIWDLSDSLSSRVALSFQWVPGHAGLPGNEPADSFTKTGATSPLTHVPSPLAPVIAKFRHTHYPSWKTKFFSQLPPLPYSFGSSEELALPVLPAVNRPGFTATVTIQFKWFSLVLLPMQDKMEDFFLQRLQTPSAGSNSTPFWIVRHLNLSSGTTSSIFDLWSRFWSVARLLGLRGIPPSFILWMEDSTTTTTIQIR